MLSEPKGDQSQVFALAALLDDTHTDKVHQVWDLLERECGLQALDVPPYPHISFHGAAAYQLDELDRQLHEITRKIEPFRIHTTGLGVFTGKIPVVYIPVVASKPLLDIHQQLWETTSHFGTRVNMLYQPDLWVPHITILHDEIDTGCLNYIFSLFIETPFTWEIEINRLAILYRKQEEYGLYQEYSLNQ